MNDLLTLYTSGELQELFHLLLRAVYLPQIGGARHVTLRPDQMVRSSEAPRFRQEAAPRSEVMILSRLYTDDFIVFFDTEGAGNRLVLHLNHHNEIVIDVPIWDEDGWRGEF